MKALLVNIDLMVRVVVRNDATAEEIMKAATLQAKRTFAFEGDSFFTENAGEWKDDTVVPYSTEYDGGYGGNWVFERQSGYAGFRCTKCGEWHYDSEPLKCKCEGEPERTYDTSEDTYEDYPNDHLLERQELEDFAHDDDQHNQSASDLI